MKWKKILTRENSVFMNYILRVGAARKLLDIGIDYRMRNHKIVDPSIYIDENDFQQVQKQTRAHTHRVLANEEGVQKFYGYVHHANHDTNSER